MSLTMHTAAERPDLWDRGIESATVWPEYNLHGDVLNRWWGHLEEELADYQFVLYDDATDEVVAEGHTGPFRWDGHPYSLPLGIDAVLELIFTQHRAGETPNTLCALAAETPRQNQASGMASQLLTAMRTIGTRQRLTHFVAPVRPSLKERYPLTRIERYVTWRREDHQLFDPWMRVHERLGARLGPPCRSRCSSPEPSKTGRPGRPWPSRSRVNTRSPKDWPPLRSTARPTAELTGSPTCG
jgi:hypothetical protein